MKKFIYILLIAAFSSVALNACTEEEVTPVTNDNGGGAVTGDKLPG